MTLINVADGNGNWWETLALWNRVVNWSYYQTSDRAFLTQVKTLIGFLWNEKDWLKTQYPRHRSEIEKFVNGSTHVRVVADLANTIKHRELTRQPRSTAQQANYYGRVRTRSGSRKLYYIEVEKGELREIMEILRGALDEYQQLRQQCAA
jgi:hypothetical protein